MYGIGMDIGYSAIKTALVDGNNKIHYTKYSLHRGDIKGTLKNHLRELVKNYNSNEITFGAMTGKGSGLFFRPGQIEPVNEVTALVEGSIGTDENIRSIIEIGGQGAKYITGFKKEERSGIKISMNSNCSAGTGSFLEEQISRLNLNLEDYSAHAARAGSIPRIAGRCSVFAKTDITHHQQEGTPVEDILLGLAYAVVRNFRVAVMKKRSMEKPVLFAGGVAHNQGIVTALKNLLDLKDEELIIPGHFSCVGAVGAAILGIRGNRSIDLNGMIKDLERVDDDCGKRDEGILLPPLISFGWDDSRDRHDSLAIGRETPECFLGIDVGSTSTNLVLSDRDNDIISHRYLRTKGDPATAVKQGLKELKEAFGNRITVIGAGVTGSGRYHIARLVGADVVKDEITAQAKAAVAIDPNVDTIFEIGGQDSKFISIRDGRVVDFQMNKVCAAGTGSFLEEQAKKFEIPINGFGDIALNSNHPIGLGERCTVFIETTIASHLARGARVDDIASGLCYAIVKNYLNRVVGRKTIGKKIFFQGGLAFNQGVINAFRAILGKDIIIPPFFSVTGALGAAILAKEEMGNPKTSFKGFEIKAKGASRMTKKAPVPGPGSKDGFVKTVERLIFEGYEPIVDPRKKTVGIPRALFTFGMFSMFNAFFKALGFNVILSDPTDEKTIGLAQEYSLDETCYPVKLINGHVAQLVAKKVDYLFFPDLYTVNHPGSETRQNYGCAYMQVAFKIINQAMELEKRGIKLLAPTIAFNQGPEFMMNSFAGLAKELGRSREASFNALEKGMQGFHGFEQRLKRNGEKVIRGIKPHEKVFVIVSKIYGVADPVLNMGIPDKLMEMGYRTISFFDLPEGRIFKEHPNLYWPFAQHILDPAYLIKEHPNLYAVLLTHHGCGPDSVTSHFFSEIMGEKPFLNIEVDEHASGVGVVTRLEAFVNSLSGTETKIARDMGFYQDRVRHDGVNIKQSLKELAPGTTLYLPNIYPYSDIFREMLAAKGVDARVMPLTTRASLDRGREHTMTNEYFSLAALVGDVFSQLDRAGEENNIAFLIPQTEGAEVDGQYSRFVRTKLDENGWNHVGIVSPFMEDLVYNDPEDLNMIHMGLLAGDLIRMVPQRERKRHVDNILDLIRNKGFFMDGLKEMAETVHKEITAGTFKKCLLAMGEPLILFNDFLNNFSFSRLEDKGHRIVYAPFSEYMQLFWRDFAEQNGKEKTGMLKQRLARLQDDSNTIGMSLNGEAPFEASFDSLIARADKTLGFYAGTNGRYREAKILGDLQNTDGIITATSMYENTGIALNILHRGFEEKTPVLNLTFDGNRNENDETRMASFLFYLAGVDPGL
ncbi:MAG: CoA protein activase [Desulfobacteraceae bacterium]|nr:CoA protein activase [Desulfobacteraceae bacterium]